VDIWWPAGRRATVAVYQVYFAWETSIGPFG
jgi:hypothetical protein